MSFLIKEQIIERVKEEGGLEISPFMEEAVQPGSYDIHLSDLWLEWEKPADFPKQVYQISADNIMVEKHTKMKEQDSFVLMPGEFALAQSLERIKIPTDLGAMLWDKSTLARLGITCCNGGSGWIDPGFEGHLVLELKNNGTDAMTLLYGMPVGQLVFMRSAGLALPYKGHYQEQKMGFNMRKWRTAIHNLYARAIQSANKDLTERYKLDE